ncbi:tetratricopeptide repeat protein [Candidatus Poribacteria bacterium]|nr:tetratricopeptide repeat protein [Candidatus Poribacteria bacterium]
MKNMFRKHLYDYGKLQNLSSLRKQESRKNTILRNWISAFAGMTTKLYLFFNDYFIYKIPVIIFLVLFLQACSFYAGDMTKDYNSYGVKCAKMGLWNEAIMRWTNIIELDPDNAKAHNNLGVAYEAKGNFEMAMVRYKTAIELDPDNKVYRSNYSKFMINYQRNVEKGSNGVNSEIADI